MPWKRILKIKNREKERKGKTHRRGLDRYSGYAYKWGGRQMHEHRSLYQRWALATERIHRDECIRWMLLIPCAPPRSPARWGILRRTYPGKCFNIYLYICIYIGCALPKHFFPGLFLRSCIHPSPPWAKPLTPTKKESFFRVVASARHVGARATRTTTKWGNEMILFQSQKSIPHSWPFGPYLWLGVDANFSRRWWYGGAIIVSMDIRCWLRASWIYIAHALRAS